MRYSPLISFISRYFDHIFSLILVGKSLTSGLSTPIYTPPRAGQQAIEPDFAAKALMRAADIIENGRNITRYIFISGKIFTTKAIYACLSAAEGAHMSNERSSPLTSRPALMPLLCQKTQQKYRYFRPRTMLTYFSFHRQSAAFIIQATSENAASYAKLTARTARAARLCVSIDGFIDDASFTGAAPRSPFDRDTRHRPATAFTGHGTTDAI